ncbi:hypothetical protein ACQP1G_17295 [Nocardia sp. CA-107356]|uniref:hypothetical protein n=1 Tax=Nocardia sp. CA-107356 TaxID=3239972 RepID=UPI003D8F20B4
MGDKIQIDPELLRMAAKKTSRARDRVDSVINTLQASIAAREKSWGNDLLGDPFANGQGGAGGYLKSRDNMIEGARNVAGTMDNFYHGQVKWASYLDQKEHGNSDLFRGFR